MRTVPLIGWQPDGKFPGILGLQVIKVQAEGVTYAPLQRALPVFYFLPVPLYNLLILSTCMHDWR